MFANCFFKKRILPCCDVMDNSCLCPFLSFNISETKHVIKNLKADVSLTLKVQSCRQAEIEIYCHIPLTNMYFSVMFQHHLLTTYACFGIYFPRKASRLIRRERVNNFLKCLWRQE